MPNPDSHELSDVKIRLDQALTKKGLVTTRSQAENYIKLGLVRVNNHVAKKPGQVVGLNDKLKITAREQYVSRAALKLASVAGIFKINFRGTIVLDVGSSTGGFSEFAVKNGAKKVIAVDVGSNQLHPSLRQNPRIELHEQTDIRDFATDLQIDVVLIDVSFISLREILPSIAKLSNQQTGILAMVKPQFEARQSNLKHKGVIKNDKIRREILQDFEAWTRNRFKIQAKADSAVPGAKGNKERFYLLSKLT